MTDPTSVKLSHRLLAVALPVLLPLALAGCASTPQERFYVLSSSLPARAAPSHTGATIIVEPAALPDVVDRPQLVLHTEAQRVAILEQQRWAEPLRAGISRVVAESLAKQLGNRAVSSREDALRRPDCRVSLDVRRFEARANHGVAMETLWTVMCTNAARQTGWSSAHEPVASADPSMIIVAQGRALDRLSRDIAPALAKR